MKVVICGDSHIGAVFGLGGQSINGSNSRVDDYEKTLNHIADYCIENKADIFVQTGDAFDKRNPSPEHLEIFNKVLKKLSTNNILSVVIMGNHDYKKTGDTYTSSILSLSARDWPNVRTVIYPELITYSKGLDTVNLLLMPYRDRKLYLNKNTKEDSILYEKEVENLLQQKQSGATIAVGHNFYYEGSYSDYAGSEVLARIEAFKGCDFVAMGHHHSFKILKKSDPIAIYTGSMERLNFGDADSKKVFIEFDTMTKQTKVMTTPIKDLLDATIDLSATTAELINQDLYDELDKIKDDVKDSIVRVKIIVHEKLSVFVKKIFVEKTLYDFGAHYVSKVNIEQIYQRMIRDTSILEEKDNFNMFKAFVQGQSFDKNLEEGILTEIKTIME